MFSETPKFSYKIRCQKEMSKRGSNCHKLPEATGLLKQYNVLLKTQLWHRLGETLLEDEGIVFSE